MHWFYWIKTEDTNYVDENTAIKPIDLKKNREQIL